MGATKEVQKPRVINLKDGQVLFHKGELSEALYIIQAGRLRTFDPRTRGTVELSVLEPGEVIGTLAYFDQEYRKHTFSAGAIGPADMIEVPFEALDNIIHNTNPWLRAIFQTLAERLKDATKRLKELDSFSVSRGASGTGEYVFLGLFDVNRILSTIFLVAKVYGEEKDGGGLSVSLKRLKFYLHDTYLIAQAKVEEFLLLLKGEGLLELEGSPGEGQLVRLTDVNAIKSLIAFFNGQRVLEEHQRLEIGPKCQQMLGLMVDELKDQKMDNPSRAIVDVKKIIAIAQEKGIKLTEGDLQDAVQAKICEEVSLSKQNHMISFVNWTILAKLYPAIKVLNAIAKLNKARGAKKRH